MSAAPTAVSSSHAERQLLFRHVMGRFATGVTVVTTRVGEETFGMTANAFMAGSLEPMLCIVSINRKAQMHGRLRQAGHYGVSFLTQEQQHFAAHFAGKRLHGLTPDFEVRGVGLDCVKEVGQGVALLRGPSTVHGHRDASSEGRAR